jgi:hypothetical protein
MGDSFQVAHEAAAVWRRRASEAISQDERRECLSFADLCEQSARGTDKRPSSTPIVCDMLALFGGVLIAAIICAP